MKTKVTGNPSSKARAPKVFQSHGFINGQTYPAVVTKIKDNRVFFNMQGRDGITLKAAYFINGHMINPHLVFAKGKNVPVILIRPLNFRKNALGIDFEVIPEMLPVDIFFLNYLINGVNTVDGVIHKINGATMIVELAPNVYATTKRCRHAHTFMKVRCKIDKYSARKRTLSVRVVE